MRRVLFAALVAVTPGLLRADTCNTVMIPNFRRVPPLGSVMSLAWDQPNPASPITFEVVQHTKADYCTTVLDPEQVVTTTSATSYSFALTPGKAAVVHVRKAGDPCFHSNFVVGDAFTSPPSKPNAPTVTPGGQISVNYSDATTQLVQFQRQSLADFQIVSAGAVNSCAPNPKTATDTTVSSGVYRYRVFVANAAGFTTSDFVNVTIGNAPPLQIVSFTATPDTIANGNPSSVATLSWVTTGADTVTLTPGPGTNVNPSGSFTAKPGKTTTFTLTAKQNTQTVTASVTVTVLTLPFLNITKVIDPIIEVPGSGASATYGLTNVGGTPTTVTLSQTDVITQSPSTFNLDAGATQMVTITAAPQPVGSTSVPFDINYTTGPNTSRIHAVVQVFTLNRPQGPVSADPQQLRVDVQGDPSTNPTGTVTFTNSGTATLTGVLSADVEWIVPQTASVTIAPKQSGTFSFTIDRSKRPDSGSLAGSLAGHLKLAFLKPGDSGFAKNAQQAGGSSAAPSVSLVKVVDTVSSPVTTAGIPALGANEVALFVPGVGHTTTSTGTTFVSDVTVFNAQGSRAADDVKLYYTSISGAPASSKTTSLPSVPSQASVAVADVVKTVFSGSNEVGTLHIRSRDASNLAVAASTLATSGSVGTLGNSIPILRSDRAAATGNALVFTGIRKDTTTHTDLYIQETAGSPAAVQIDFLAADGSTIKTQPAESLDAFRLRQLKDVAPPNAVAAIVTNISGGGKIAGYAIAADDASGDTWSIGDWSSQYGYDASSPAVIPIAGSLRGTNDTAYRSEIAITNRGTGSASASLAFIGRNGTRADRAISLGGHQTTVITDALGVSDTTGYVIVTPDAGSSVAVSSRVVATPNGKTTASSTAVPVIAASTGVRQGVIRPVAGLTDAARTTVIDAKAGTFRTNFGLMEVSGLPATIRVTLRFTFAAGDKVSGAGSAYRDYALAANGFMMLNSITGEIIGGARLQFGDLQNVTASFQVIDGDGSVIVFTSTVDNASGDAILRTE